MAKGQSIILLLIILLISYQAGASPWLPLPGKTKYQIKGRYVDSRARKLKKLRGKTLDCKTKIINSIYEKQYWLELERDQKIAKLKGDDRYNQQIIDGLNNRYKELIKYGQKLIVTLDEDAFKYNVYPDHFALEAGVEYGINDNLSGSLGILYNYQQFRQTRYSNYDKVLRQASVSAKAKLYTYKALIVSFEPKFFTSDFGNSFELNLLSGYSRRLKRVNNFRSLGFGIGKSLQSYNNDIYYTFSVSEGIEFNNGIMLNVYSKYRYGKKTFSPYCRTLYAESSIAKKFKLKNSNLLEALVISTGYFWDKSLRYDVAATSGFMASIWFET